METSWIIILSSLVLSAFFSGMEIAFVSANKIHIEIEKKQEGFLAAVLSRITKKPSKFIATMLIGNNAALVFAGLEGGKAAGNAKPARRLIVRAYACLTGAGGTAATLERFFQGASCKGVLAADRLTDRLPPRSVRRMKRLARMALGLSTRTLEQAGTAVPIREVYFGTAWGALSETHDFLDKLYASNEFYTSPIDFVGSVHNAPAGQVAIREKIEGPNVTMTGGDASFEQALLAAAHLGADGRPRPRVGQPARMPAVEGGCHREVRGPRDGAT
mgnify:CR=1 FL=1